MNLVTVQCTCNKTDTYTEYLHDATVQHAAGHAVVGVEGVGSQPQVFQVKHRLNPQLLVSALGAGADLTVLFIDNC